MKRMASLSAAGDKAFAAAVGEYGDDPLATFHLTRTLAGETGINITLADK